MIRNIFAITLAALLSFAPFTNADQLELSGRVHYSATPGNGSGSMGHPDKPFPQEYINVGPTKTGNALACLVAIDILPEGKQALIEAQKAEFVLNLADKQAYNGYPPSEIKVALLATGLEKNKQYVQFQAWNSAPDFAVIGSLPVNPTAGEYRFDITTLMKAIQITDVASPVMFFAIYSPDSDLTAANEGKHIFIKGDGANAPRIDITN